MSGSTDLPLKDAVELPLLPLRDVVVFTVSYGLVNMLAGWGGIYVVFLAALVGIGVSRLLYATTAETLVQLSTNPGMRGRIVSFYMMIMMGGQAAGGIVMGWIAENWGGQIAFTIAGAVPTATGLVVAIILLARHEMRIKVDLRGGRRMFTFVPREGA